MAEAVKFRRLDAEARFQFKAISCGIYVIGQQLDTGIGFSRSTSVFLHKYLPIDAAHSHFVRLPPTLYFINSAVGRLKKKIKPHLLIK